MTETGLVSAVQEDYLETILHLVTENGSARVRDIAAELKVHKSTVTSALRHLAEMGLVNYRPYEAVTLTPAGHRLAGDVAGRHRILRRFLVDVVGLEGQEAEENACRIEHVVDRRALEKIEDLMDFFNHSRSGEACRRSLAAYHKSKGGNR